MRTKLAECVIHIGTEKTGTSSIQRFLSANRQQLLSEGIVYPLRCGAEGGSQTAFVAASQRRPWTTRLGRGLGITSPVTQQALREELSKNIADCATRSPLGRLLISSEHFHSRMVDIDEIATLKKLLEPYVESFRVIAYLRRQDRLAVSAFSTKIQSGTVNPVLFPEIANNGDHLHYFDYLQLYRKWSEVFGGKSIIFKIFDRREFEEGDLLVDFASMVGFKLNGKILLGRANESIDQHGLDFLLQANKLMASERGSVPRTTLHALISRLRAGKASLATKAEAKAFYQRFTASNMELQQRAFPARSGTLFDDDFSEYPDNILHEPDYASAVQIGLDIWSQGERNARQLKAEVLYYRALLAKEHGKFDEAVDELNKAVALKKNYLEAYAELAKLHQARNDRLNLDKTIQILTRLDKNSLFATVVNECMELQRSES